MLYITLLDQFHPGIYSSQVIDVCEHISKNHKRKVRLVAFLSIRELFTSGARNKIRELSPRAIVLPAFPGLRFFEITSVLLFFVCLITGERIAICRNVLCTKMALRVRKIGLLKKVVLDGRSAIAAEIHEYDVFPLEYFRKNIERLEAFSVNQADYRMTVSEELVSYWKRRYRYDRLDHVVIPCTLDTRYFFNEEYVNDERTGRIKSVLGIGVNEVLLVYSGSGAPWQSFELLVELIEPLLISSKDVKLLFLSKENDKIRQFREKYPHQVLVRWVDHSEVNAYLHCCDYGVLLREQSDTNRVASPVKFAEYLYAGLPVLISENLGDFSGFVSDNKCGFVLKKPITDWGFIRKVRMPEKIHCFKLARRYFAKESGVIKEKYEELLSKL